MDRENNLNLLLKLSEKISKKIKKLKDKVYEISEVKILIDNFMELKNNYENRKKSGQVHCPHTNSHGHNTCSHHTIELNENLKNIIKLMIVELKKVYIAILNSSQDIENIFKGPLKQLTDEGDTKYEKFNFEEIHREEFCKCVYKDDFIKTIIFQMKKKITNYEDISDLITDIEWDLNKGTKEMTRFTMCIGEEQRKISLNNKKKEKFKDIDDLVKYINTEETAETKPKKTKKKGQKKDRKVHVKAEVEEKQLTMNKEQIELEIEEFKHDLTENSVKAFSIRKIIPKISEEWLSSIRQGVPSN